jgi:uncharacterized protein (DUF58 family)
VRQALAGLTTRGRCFLAAGAAAALTAILLGEHDLLRVAVLVLVLPLASAAMVYRTRYRLASSRRMEPARVAAGEEARALLRLENVSRLPTGVLLIEDRIPYILGTRPRFILDRVESHGIRQVAYGIRSQHRGRYTVGPLTIRLRDPFGMCELVRSFTAVDSFVVTPVIEPLPSLPLSGDWVGTGESRSRSIASAGDDDVVTREYRRGDDLRRVHWRATAHYGELMVRREEQPWGNRAVLLVDTRRGAHRGDGPTSSFETAVSAAASIAIFLGRAGFRIDVITDTGQRLTDTDDGRINTHEEIVLDAFAELEESGNRTIRTASNALREAGDGLTVAVLGALTVEEASELARARHGAGSAVAVIMDLDTWRPGHTRHPAADRHGANGDRPAANGAAGGAVPAPAGLPGSVDPPIEVLRAAGWRVVALGSGQKLSSVWPLVAHSPFHGRLETAGPGR